MACTEVSSESCHQADVHRHNDEDDDGANVRWTLGWTNTPKWWIGA